MKYCPQCQTSYTDDTLRFCNRDGAPLVNSNEAQTINFGEEATVVSSRQVEPIRVPIENEPPRAPQQNWQPSAPLPPPQYQPQPQIIAQPPPEIKKSKTGLAIALTAFGMLVLFGLIGAAVYLMGNRKTEVAVGVNNASVNRPANSNAAVNQNLNANVAAATPTATPTAKPTLDPKQAKTVTADVGGVVDEWKSSTENLDIDAHVNQYADTVDYYKAGKVGVARVRADRQRAFDTYSALVVNISNLKVTPDASGEKAIATFDKEWDFTGEDKYSTGKVQQQLTFAKINGSWKITGEKDLKLYYKE